MGAPFAQRVVIAAGALMGLVQEHVGSGGGAGYWKVKSWPAVIERRGS